MSDKKQNRPSKLAWFVFRSISRYLVSLFIPSFRFFGEFSLRKGGQIFIIKNYDFQSWVYPFIVFKKPVRFILADKNSNLKWYNILSNGGLYPIKIDDNLEINYPYICDLINSGEKIIIIIPESENNEFSINLINKLKHDYENKLCFMGLSSGVKKVFSENSIIPKHSIVNMVCGLPYTYPKDKANSTFEEFHILETSANSADDISEPLYLAYLLNTNKETT